MSKITDDISDLRVAQAKTHTAVERLSDTVRQYIEMDESRYQALLSSRLETTKILSEVVSTLKEVKSESKKVVSETVPKMGERVAKVESVSRIHGWFIKSLMLLTVIASLGGLIGGMNSCQASPARAEISSSQGSVSE